MKVLIPSYNRHRTISTHKCFAGCDYTVLVHSMEQLTKYGVYRKDTGLDMDRVRVTDTPPGLTRQREWGMHNLTTPGEWFVFADDNIRQLTALDPSGEEYWQDELPEQATMQQTSALYRPMLRCRISTGDLNDIFADTVAKCKSVGARLAGFSLTDNPAFRLKKWRTAGYAIGKLMVWQHQDDFPWNHSISMEDFYHTAVCLLRDGAVVVNNYVWPVAGHYEPGGMGPYEERIPQRIEDVKVLMDHFLGLFRVKERKGFFPGTELQLRLHSPKQVAAWREQMFRTESMFCAALGARGQ